MYNVVKSNDVAGKKGEKMQNLRDFRKTRGLSQVEMARKLGYTLSMYEKVERGRTRFSVKFLIAFKSAFPDANIDYIFFGNNSKDVAVRRRNDE